MQVSDVDKGLLRRLAEWEAPEGAKVLSLFLNLDPSEFATGEARSTAITSLLDEAGRAVDDAEDLSHDERKALRADVDRLQSDLTADTVPQGAHALALFACGPAQLDVTLRLPRPVEQRVEIGDGPFLEPLVALAERDSVAIILVDRREGRVLVGSRDALQEVADLHDDTKNQHSQGGWSQQRYERSVDQEAKEHIQRVTSFVARRHDRTPFDHLLVVAPDEVIHGVEEQLTNKLRDIYAGRVSAPTKHDQASVDDIREAAFERLAELDRDREREALDSLASGLGSPDGNAAAGLADVLEALNEYRVETLLYASGYGAAGVRDPQNGWLGTTDFSESPVTGGEVEQVEDVLEAAIELAVKQDAKVLRVRHFDDLEERGGIAAVLRF
jgi:peptide subunit release factor 1 (eRF1)